MATILLQPPTISVTAGSTFSVKVVVNAQRSPLVSSQFQLNYPANLLTPVSFTFAPGWTQSLDQGYDVLSGGKVIQSGGYSDTFSGSMLMGTLTFQANTTGEATLSIVNSNTFAFETDGGNLYTGPAAMVQVGIGPGTGVAQPAAQVAGTGPQDVTPAPIPNVFSSVSQSASTVSGDISFADIPLGIWIVAVLLCSAWFTYRALKRKRTRHRR